MTAISIENIIATTHLHQHFNLDHVANTLPDAIYDPEKKAAVVFHFEEPRSAVLLSSEGKIVCTGSTSLSKAEENIKDVVTQLQSLIDSSIVNQPIIQRYIIATATFGTPLILEVIANALSLENITYQPEINPWLKYQMSDEFIVLLFPSGSIVFIGKVMPSDIEEALNTLKNKLSSIGVL